MTNLEFINEKITSLNVVDDKLIFVAKFRIWIEYAKDEFQEFDYIYETEIPNNNKNFNLLEAARKIGRSEEYMVFEFKDLLDSSLKDSDGIYELSNSNNTPDIFTIIGKDIKYRVTRMDEGFVFKKISKHIEYYSYIE